MPLLATRIRLYDLTQRVSCSDAYTRICVVSEGLDESVTKTLLLVATFGFFLTIPPSEYAAFLRTFFVVFLSRAVTSALTLRCGLIRAPPLLASAPGLVCALSPGGHTAFRRAVGSSPSAL